jgi:glycosyltransferase involved in cell wall biosynthesis
VSPELALHVLAQLGDRASIRLEDRADRLAQVKLIARAYGIEDRVELVNVGGEPAPRAQFSIDRIEQPIPDGSFAAAAHSLSAGGAAPTSRGDDGILGGTRVAVVTNRRAHYRVPLFDGVDRRLRAAGASLRVYFVDGESPERPWLTGGPGDFEWEYLPSVTLPIRRHRRPSALTRVGAAIRHYQPTTILVAGLSPLVAGRMPRTARRLHASVGVWSGETPRAPSARGGIKRRLRRSLLASLDFGVAYGWESARYLRTLAPSLPVVIGRNTSPLPERVAHRSVPRPRMLAVGDLASDRKGMDVLVDALASRPELDCELRIVGGGRLLASLATRAERDERIHVLGPLSPDDTRGEMSRSDAYLFPTRFDVFGLSLVEAMGCGLPSVVTPHAGAVEDLCVPGLNSIVVGGHDPGEWAEAISQLVAEPEKRASLGIAAAETIAARWTMEHAVDSMIAGLRLGVLTAR